MFHVYAGFGVLHVWEFLRGGDHGWPRDQLDGSHLRLVSHAVRHRGPLHRFPLRQDGPQVMGQKHLRMCQSLSSR